MEGILKMQGPRTGLMSPEPQIDAVAYLSPPKNAANSPEQNRGLFITPEGFDVSSPEGARAYLTEVHGYELPVIHTDLDAMEALANIERAAIYEDGRKQNVLEHTLNLMEMVEDSTEDWPDEERELAYEMAEVHDWPEDYGRDTSIKDSIGLKTKFWREAAGITLLIEDLGYEHPKIQTMLKYHGYLPMSPQEERAYRRVHALDKVEPYAFQITQNGALHLQRGENIEEIASATLPKLVEDDWAFHVGVNTLKALGNVLSARQEDLQDTESIIERLSARVRGLAAFPLSQSVEAPHYNQPVIDPETLRQLGVIVLSDRRSHRPTPPTPGSPAVAISAA